MKPTPTPEMIEAHAIADAKFAGMDFATLGRADKKRFLERAASCLSAALSVQPAAAVVGEPVAWTDAVELDAVLKLGSGVMWSAEEQHISRGEPIALYAASSAPEGWQPIETAPKDGTLILVWRAHSNKPLMVKWDSQCDAFEDEFNGHHVYHLTHWRQLPAPPAFGEKS